MSFFEFIFGGMLELTFNYFLLIKVYFELLLNLIFFLINLFPIQYNKIQRRRICSGLNPIIPSYTPYYPIILDYTRLHPIILDYTQLYPIIPDYTRLYPIIPDYTRLYPITPIYGLVLSSVTVKVQVQ